MPEPLSAAAEPPRLRRRAGEGRGSTPRTARRRLLRRSRPVRSASRSVSAPVTHPCRTGDASGAAAPVSCPTGAATCVSVWRPRKDRRGREPGAGGISDRRATADSITPCVESWKTETDSYTGEFTGKLSGFTVTGTWTTHRTGHFPADPGRMIDETYSGPVTYVCSPDGGATPLAGGATTTWTTRASRRCEDTVRSASVRLAQSLA